jgi:5-(carboxyamino)imidazole ribonucleotide synthase
LKTASFGYDGKGQRKIRRELRSRSRSGLSSAGECAILEKWVRFEKEISVIVARAPTGRQSPTRSARTSPPPHSDIDDCSGEYRTCGCRTRDARSRERSLRGSSSVGLLAVEMFLLEDETILIKNLRRARIIPGISHLTRA